MKPSEFLRALWGPDPTGYLELWELRYKRSTYLTRPDQADHYAEGRADVYCAVGLAKRRYGRKERTKADQVIGIPGLWIDIDITGPAHPQGDVPTMNAAMELAHAILPPTLLVRTGNGLHAWWLFDGGAWRFCSRLEQAAGARMAAQLQQLHRDYAQGRGWQVGYLHDLARLMRMPGTRNGKQGADTPVTASPIGPRYERTMLAELCEAAGPIELRAAARATGVVVDISGASLAPGVLDALLHNDHDFNDCFHHRYTPSHWSMSEHDMALAARAAHIGLTDPQIAGLIRAHRLAHDPTDVKHKREKYVMDTIGLARTRRSGNPDLTKARQRAARAA